MKQTQKDIIVYVAIGICWCLIFFMGFKFIGELSISADDLEPDLVSEDLRQRALIAIEQYDSNSSNSSNDSSEETNDDSIVAQLTPPTRITLARTKLNTVEELDVETYIQGVVAAEMMNTFEIEALKAQAIAIRGITFSRAVNSSKHAKYNNADVCDNHRCCQAYNPGKINEAIIKAVNETKGLTPLFAGNYAQTLYFASTMEGTLTDQDVWGNKTETTSLYRTLSGPSPEANAISYAVNKYPYAQDTTTISINSFIKIANRKYPKAKLNNSNIKNNLKILSRTEGGFVDTVQLGNVKISGSKFRSLVEGLKSSNFDITFSGSKIKIISKGYGHGVGMSQWGANALAEEGKNYSDILNYYYQNLSIEQLY